MNSQHFKNAVVQTITFSKKLPYTIDENETELIFRVYNPELSDDSVYNLNIPKPEKYVYSVNLEDGKYIFKVRSLPDTLSELNVVIDAGHGVLEKGAIGCLGDEEKDINLKIALKTKEYLNEHNINVILTRDLDSNLSLAERVDIAKENCADIFVSIHLNSIGDVPFNIHKHKGTSVYFYNDNSKNLAKKLNKAIISTASTHNDGIKTASFAVIRPTEYISALVEAAYMINPTDTILYKNQKWIDKVAKGIADGIVQFIEE